jgi:hypothetical protein
MLRLRGDAAEDPFLINVLVLPGSTSGAFADLAGTLRDSPRRVAFETRPIAEMNAGPRDKVRPLLGGVSVGSDSGGYATLGGILEDSLTGHRYGVTCGHAVAKGQVVKQPSPRDSRRAERIGTCVASTAETLSGPVPDCKGSVATNQVDAALIELDADPSVASELRILESANVVGWMQAGEVCEQTPVSVSGRRGRRNLHTRGLWVTGSLLANSQRYCFRNLIEITRSSPRFWGITGTLSPPAAPGDSGAWVIQSGPRGPEWCGMIISGDGPVALAVFSDYVMDWLAANNYANLSVTHQPPPTVAASVPQTPAEPEYEPADSADSRIVVGDTWMQIAGERFSKRLLRKMLGDVVAP